MNARKIQRRMAKQKKKEKRTSDFSWDTVNDMYKSCGTTIVKNAKLVSTLLSSDALSNADTNDLDRINVLTARVTNELVAQLNSINSIADGRVGELGGIDTTDFDDALIICDRYSHMVDSISEQYSTITDAVYQLKTQLETENEKA